MCKLSCVGVYPRTEIVKRIFKNNYTHKSETQLNLGNCERHENGENCVMGSLIFILDQT